MIHSIVIRNWMFMLIGGFIGVLWAQTGQPEVQNIDSLSSFYRVCPEANLTVPSLDGKNAYPSTDIARFLSFGHQQLLHSSYREVPRFGVWGDSHTASGDFMVAALQEWGFSKNSIRPALIQPAIRVPGVRLPLKKTCLTTGWRESFAHRALNQEVKFSTTLLQLSSNTPNDMFWVDFRSPDENTRLKWLNLHYTKKEVDRSLILGVSIDNGVEQIFNLSDETSLLLRLKSETPFATVRVRLVAGQISIHGLEPFYLEPPKALLDIFSSPGATAKVWSDMMLVKLGDRSYDAVIFEYGTNEGMDPQFDEATYAKGLRQSLSNFRKIHPKAICMLVGPPERGNLGNGEVRPYARAHQSINRIQSQVAKELGCTQWNWQSAMGGAGSANRLMSSTPPILKKDQIHLTQEGYELSGQWFAKSMSWKKN